MSLDKKMSKIMKDLKFPCENHSMTHRGVIGLLRTVHKLAMHGELKELKQNYENIKCPKLKGYIWDVYNDGVKKKAHRFIKKGEIKNLDKLYRAQDCEELHRHIEEIYQSEKKFKDIGL